MLPLQQGPLLGVDNRLGSDSASSWALKKLGLSFLVCKLLLLSYLRKESQSSGTWLTLLSLRGALSDVGGSLIHQGDSTKGWSFRQGRRMATLVNVYPQPRGDSHRDRAMTADESTEDCHPDPPTPFPPISY